MTRIMGYADRVSLQPGETVRIMASCIGAKSYRAEIVRLLARGTLVRDRDTGVRRAATAA